MTFFGMIFLLACPGFHACEPAFVRLKQGQKAPFGGRLFNSEAVSKLIIENRYKAEQCNMEIEYYKSRTKAEEKLKYDLLEAKYAADKQRHADLLALKQEENKRLQKYVKPSKDGWWLAGGFMLGTATSISIMYVVKGGTQ